MVLCMYLNIENVIPIMFSNMSQAFPNASLISIQQIPSVMYLVESAACFAGGWFVSKLSKRRIIIIFQAGTVAGGLFAYFFGTTVAMLYLSAFIIGFSASLVSVISRSIVVENFTGDDVPKVIGASQIANSLGTMMLQMLTGYLAVIHWKMGYLTFLFGLVSLFSAVFLLPEGPLETREPKTGQRAKIWTRHLIHDIVLTCVFLLVNMTYTSNISYLVTERNLGDSVVTGYLSSLRTAFVFLAAIFLPAVLKAVKKYCLTFSLLCVIAGYLLVTVSPNVWMVAAGTALAGFGQGIFTPAIFAHIARHVNQSTNSISHAMIQAAGNAGIYLYPYVITVPSLLLGTAAVYRFAVALPLAIVLLIAETIYQHYQTEY